MGYMSAADALKQLAREPEGDRTPMEALPHLQPAKGYLKEARRLIAGL
jgi:hypothetical protein